MKSIAEIRKDNLIYIIERYYNGKQKLLADALGVAPSMISRYLSPKDLKVIVNSPTQCHVKLNM
ncbi:hypothetical protein IC611_15105 [Proteus mirabilis]